MSDILEEEFKIKGDDFLHIYANCKILKMGVSDQGKIYVEEIENVLDKVYNQKKEELESQ